MRHNIEHILSYIKVVELGSFTKAAQELRLSKSVISKHISALEENLKTQLIKRSTRQLMVTEIGQAFYQQVKTIPEQLNNATNFLHAYHEQPHGLLKVISPINFSASLKLEVVPQFMKQFPEVKLQLRFERPVEDYVNDDFDIIVMWKFDHVNFADYNLVAKPLFKMPVGIYATPAYLQQFGTPQTPEDLQQHHCLSSISNKWPFRDADGNMSLQHISGNLETNSDEMIHGVVMNDLALAYSYPFMYLQALSQGTVVPVLQDYTHMTLDICAFYHPSPYQPMKIRAFLQAMQTYYERTQLEILSLRNVAQAIEG